MAGNDPFSVLDDIDDQFSVLDGDISVTPKNNASSGTERTVLGTLGDVGVTALKGAVGLPEAAVGLADIVSGGHAGKSLEESGYRPKETREFLDTLYSPAQQEANRRVSEADGFIDTVGEAVRNPSTIAHTAIESAPLILGAGAIARGAMQAIPRLAPTIAGAVGEGTAAAGATAESVRQQTKDGLLTPKQALLSLGTGAGTTGIGVFGGKLANRLGIGDIETIAAGGARKAVAEGAEETAKSLPRRVAEGAIVEGVFEELPQSLQEQALQNIALDKPTDEGLAEAGAMGMLAGNVIGGGAAAISPSGPLTKAANSAPAQEPLQDIPPSNDIDVAPGNEALINANQTQFRQRPSANEPTELINQREPTQFKPSLRQQMDSLGLSKQERVDLRRHMVKQGIKSGDEKRAFIDSLAMDGETPLNSILESLNNNNRTDGSNQPVNREDNPIRGESLEAGEKGQLVGETAKKVAEELLDNDDDLLNTNISQAVSQNQQNLDKDIKHQQDTVSYRLSNKQTPGTKPDNNATVASESAALEFKPTHEDEVGEQYQHVNDDLYRDNQGQEWSFNADELTPYQQPNASITTQEQQKQSVNQQDSNAQEAPLLSTQEAINDTTRTAIPNVTGQKQDDGSINVQDTILSEQAEAQGQETAVKAQSEQSLILTKKKNSYLNAQRQAFRKEHPSATKGAVDNHVAKLKQSYEDDWLKAAASLPFEEYQALPENKEQPAGLLRSTYDSARDEFGIKDNPVIRESRTVEPTAQPNKTTAPRTEGAPSSAGLEAVDVEKGGRSNVSDIKYSDPTEAQKLINSINEGELILRTGVFNNKKRSHEYLGGVKKSIESTKKKLNKLKINPNETTTQPTPAQEGGLQKAEARDNTVNQAEQAKVDKPETTVKFDRASAKPETIVPTTKGETDYGEISEERYPKVGREKGKIIFEYGKESKNERYGLTHIEKGHKKQIEKLGETVEDFVYSTTTDPDEIRKGAHGSILLAKKLKIKNLNKVAFVRLQPIKDSAYYRVETAFPMSKRQVEKYRLLWEKSDTSPADSDNQPSFAATTSDTVSDEGPTGTPEQSSVSKSLAQDNKESKGDDKALYSKSTKSTGSTVAQVKSWLPRRVQKLVDKGRLKVVQSVNDLPKHLQERGDVLMSFFYHGTNRAGAEAILKDGRIKGKVFLTPRKDIAFEYADESGVVFQVNVNAEDLQIDPDLPGQRTLSVDEANNYFGFDDYLIEDYIDDGYSVAIDSDVSVTDKNIIKHSKDLSGVEALYDESTDTMYMVADMLDKGNISSVLNHELYHRAEAKDPKLKEQLGKLDQRLNVRFKLAAKGKGSEIENAAYKRVMDAETPVKDQLVEYKAYLVSEWNTQPESFTGRIKQWMQDFIATIRAALIRQGVVPASITPADLNALAKYGARVSDSAVQSSDAVSVLASKSPKASKGEGKVGNTSWRNQKGFDGLTDDQFNTLNKIGPPPDSGLISKAKSEFEKHRYLWRNKLRQGVVDQYDSFASVLNDKKAWMMASLSNTGGAVAEAALEFGRPFMDKSGAVDIDTKEKSLAQIVEPLGDELDRFLMWIAGNRAEGLKLDGRENLFSDEDISNLKGLSDGEIEGKNRKELYNKVRIDFERMHNAIVQMGVDTGLVSKKDAAIWKEQGFYVPFYRLADESVSNHGPQSISGLVRQQAYKKLKGADMQLNDLLGNTLMNWNHLIGASLKNQAAAKALNSAVTMGLAKEITATQKGKNSVFVREDGKEKWFDLDGSQEGALVLDSLTALNYDGLNNTAMKAMRKFKRALTIGVTASPEFKIANLIRDSLQAIAVADMSTNIAKNLAQGFKATGKNSDTIGRMIGGGGAFGDSGYIHGGDPDAIKLTLEKGVDRATILDSRAKWKKVWDLYQDFGSRLENVNRAANFEQDLAEGKDLLTANFNARDHLDFQRTGSFVAVRAISQMVPFINARLQGLDKLGRSMVDPKQRKQFAAVVGSYAMASIALYLAMKDDDDYQEAEQWERDTYHLFKVPGSDVMFRIPRPFEVGAIANMLERGVEQMADDKVHGELFAERLWHSVTETFAMNPMPQLFKPVIETWANKNSFTGRGIESQAMQRLSKSERKKAWTSQTAIGISKAMDAILWDQAVLSPVQVEHLVNGYLGWVGATTLSGIDMIARPLTGAADKPDKRIEDYPIIGRFVREGKGRNSRFITEFYENQREINQHYSDIKRYRDNQEYDKYNNALTEYRNELKFRKYYNRTNRRIALVNKQIRLITANKTLSSDVKRRRIDKLNASRIRLAKKAVDKFERLNR